MLEANAIGFESSEYRSSINSFFQNLHTIVRFEPRHKISNNVVCSTSKGSDQPAHTHRLIRAFASRMNIL